MNPAKRNVVNSAFLLLVTHLLCSAYLRGGTSVAAWAQRYNGPANLADSAKSVAVDEHGHVYVAGTSSDIGNGSAWVSVAYSTGGTPLWTNRLDWGVDASVQGMVAARDGNVYVTGKVSDSTNGYNYATVAYSDGGTALWTNRYNGPANGYDDTQ